MAVRSGAFTEDGFLVASPNMDHVYRPLTQNVLVRLREDHSFGVDDPLFYPQPLVTGGPQHLAVIRSSTFHPDDSLAVMWISLKDEDFVSTPKDLTCNFVRLAERIRKNVMEMSLSLIAKVDNASEAYTKEHPGQESVLAKDASMKMYRSLLLDAVHLLRQPAP
jgi:hypothetical protein